MSRISVILPIYNVGRYLRKCLDSLIGQTFKDLEIICVNDGSPDDSLQILREYAAKDSRIKVIDQRNGGAASARNRGLEAASGKYVSFVDPDDWCEPEMMARLHDAAEQHDAEMTVCGFKTFDETQDRIVAEKTYSHMISIRKQPFTAASIAKGIFLRFEHAPWNKLYNRSYVNRLGQRFQNLSRAEDMSFVETCMAAATRIAVVAEPALYVYRVGRKTSSQATNDRSPLVFCEAYRELRRRLEKLGIFETFASCFRRAALNSIVYTLKSLSSAKVLAAAYKEIRKRWVGEFGLDQLKAPDFESEAQFRTLQTLLTESDPAAFTLFLLRLGEERVKAAGNEVQIARGEAALARQESAKLLASSPVLVSLIVPVHNVAPYLRRSLDSALQQTLRAIEVICVDDGSTDESPAILAEYAARDPRVKVITQENLGVSAARNAGLDIAKGVYVAFLDGDDELLPTHLWNLMAKADAVDSDLVQGGHCEVTDGVVTRTYEPAAQCTAKDLRACPQLVRYQTKYIWDKLFRRATLEANHIRFAPYGYHEDHLFLFEVDLVAKNFASVPEVGYRYSKTSAGAATRAYDARLLDCPKAYWDICRLARQAGLFAELAGSIWFNCSMSYSWRVLAFPKYDNAELQRQIVAGWYEFFKANFPRWQKNMHLAGYPVLLPVKERTKVLLLGGTGALGAHLADILAADGRFDVYVTTRSDHEDRPNLCYLKGNALEEGFFRKLMASKWDVVVDFMVWGPQAFEQRLATMLAQAGQYVFLSSSRVYADAQGQPITETSPRLLDTVRDEAYLKTSEYALAKAREENLLKASGRRNWTVIRPYVTFSEQRLQLGTLEKEHWLKRALDGKPIVFSDDVAERTTTLTYGRDVARGMAAIIGRKEAEGEVFHITNAKSLKWKDVLKLYQRVLKEVKGKDFPVVMTPTSCQLATPGKYQVMYDRVFDRRFDNAKIGRFIDVGTFKDPEQALEDCLKEFLKAPKFLAVNETLEAVHDQACAKLAPKPKMYSAERNAQILVAALKAHGINQIIASPGTTNIAFVGSVQYDKFFTVRSAPDERSAAYMACGWAAESGKPVVITCTGATASRNYLPGLTEAYYRKLPILAVCGSQYERRTGHLSPQFVDRSAAPTDTYVLKVSMPYVRSADEEWHDNVAANEAILALTRNGGGPVHLNLETRDNSDFSVAQLPGVRVINRHFAGEALPPIPAGRVAVFVGTHAIWSKELTEAVDAFCEKYDAPVFCDHTSNYRGRHETGFTLACYQQSGSCTNFAADLIIHIGEISADYPSHRICRLGKVWRVNPDGEIRDQFRRLVKVFEMNELTFFRRYAAMEGGRDNGYRRLCARQAETLLGKMPEVPFSNIWMASRSAALVPKNSFLHLGVLNSFRAWSFFPIDKSVYASCNTGGFGIDGCLSTLLGASFAHPERLHFAVLGDLAFFYDMNALGNRHVAKNLRILLINNGKGVEFRNFNHPAYQFGDEADRFVAAGGHYGNRSPRLVKDYAEDLGFIYMTASTKEEFLRQAPAFWDGQPKDRPVVFEVFTNNVDESNALERMTLIEGARPAAAPRSVGGPLPAARPKAAGAPAKGAPRAPVPAGDFKPVSPRKIAILTFHTAYNCGAHLQAWALQTVLRRFGFEPAFPDCTRIGYFRRFENTWYKTKAAEGAGWLARKWHRLRQELGALGVEDVKRHRFRMFAKRCLNIKSMQPADVERNFAAVLVGSDQVWNHCITRDETPYYRTTMFKNPLLKRYSYAISLGDRVPPPESQKMLRLAGRNFENLSFRENLLPQLTDRKGVHPTVDPDPTLLLTKEDFNTIAYPKRLERKPFLFVYSLIYSEKTWKAARAIAKEMGLKAVFAQAYQYGSYQIKDGKGVHIAVSPDRFLAYIRDAEVVITSSFHGTALSIIYGKRFATLPYVHDKVSLRCQKLLKSVREEIHQIDDPENLESIRTALRQPVKAETKAAMRRLASFTLARLRKILPDVSKAPREAQKVRPKGLSAPFAKIRGGFRCIGENGLKYTVKHAAGKALRFAGIRSSW